MVLNMLKQKRSLICLQILEGLTCMPRYGGGVSIDSQASGHVGHAQGSLYDCYLSARTPGLASKGLEMNFHAC